MAELVFTEEADAALTELERDRGRSRLLREVNHYLGRLEAHPEDGDLRKRGYLGGAFRIDLDTDDWMIAWEHGPGPDEITIAYIGIQLERR